MPGRLTFRVLGPLEIERDGVLVPLRGNRPRAVASLLLLHAGELVSTEALVDALWGETPPPTARTAIQGQVSKLRRLIADEGIASLETRDEGYVLHVDPERLDLRSFQRLAEEGRSALAEGDAERASKLLGEALALWRGSPLEDLDLAYPPHSQLAGLEQLKLAATETRIEAALQLGRHLEVLPELDGLLSEHPLSEPVHALAAVALYRAGRQADALAVCRQLRIRLSEELGLDPGPHIQRLESDILNQAASLELPPSKPDDGALWEGRRMVTALVCLASVGSGPEADHEPEAQRTALQPVIERAKEAVRAHGGAVREALSDRLVGVFGLESSHEDDAFRALAAASDVHRAAGLGPEIKLRAGVASGEVLAEESGGERSLLSAAPIDTAGRLASAARPGETLLTRTTLRLAQPDVAAEDAEILLLDDESQPMVAFRLRVVKAPRAPRRLRSPLVGREQELARLSQTFERARSDRICSLVTILGSPGIGKSRLVSEFVGGLDHDVVVLRGRCLAYGSGASLSPVTDVLKQGARIAEDDDSIKATRKLGSLLSDLEDSDFLTDQLARVLGLTEGSPEPREIFWAIRKALEAVARQTQGLVAVIDDIHWADPALLDLLEHIAAWSRDASLMVICMARPELLEVRPGWGSGKTNAINLPLEGLPGSEASLLLSHLLKDHPAVERLRRTALQGAEGNPLFLEELVSMLIESGIIALDAGRWVIAGDMTTVLIPPTIQALVAARLDELTPAERRIAERAAVIGREFTEEDVSLLAGDGEQEILQATLRRLVAKGVIVPIEVFRSGVQSYRFRHIMIRDVVYQAAAKAMRAADHERFAETLERREGDRLSEHDDVVGYHLESAYRCLSELGIRDARSEELRSGAVDRLMSAGGRAFVREDLPAASRLLERARELLPADDPRGAEVAWRLGVALQETGQMREAEEVLDSGLDAAVMLELEGLEWRIRLERVDARVSRDPGALDTFEVERIAASAIEVFERLRDKSGMARALRLMGDAIGHRGRLEEALEAFERGQVLAMEAGDDREAKQRQQLGVVHGPVPAERCIEIAQHGLARSRRPDPMALATLGFSMAMVGRIDEARESFQEARRLARELGAEWNAANVEMHRGAALLIDGDAEGAEGALRETVETLEAMGEKNMLSTAAALLAEALFRQGKLDEAMATTLASESATAPDDAASQMAWRGVRAKILASRGELAEAEQLAREGVAFADQTDYLNMVGDSYMDLAYVLERSGRSSKAAEAADHALESWKRKGNIAAAAKAATTVNRLRAFGLQRTS